MTNPPTEQAPHLRRGIDAMAHRIERLRATGNGVDPVAAAYAFVSLGTLLGIFGRTAAGEPVLMESAVTANRPQPGAEFCAGAGAKLGEMER